MPRRLGWIVLLLLPGLAPGEAKLDRAACDALVKDTLSRWGAPGLAVALVRGDDTHLAGFGLRAQGKPERVTPDTVFALASLTKAFTATALGILVDEGKLDWDDPVRRRLDWFRLHDPLADRDVTLRDLLCHRTGLGRHDLLWYRAGWSVEESVRRMAHLEAAHAFRTRYEYNNLGYLAAGLVVHRTAGQPWNDYVQHRLLDPLGMKTAVFTDAEARARPDHATPHQRDAEGNLVPIAWYPDAKQIRAAGSLKAGVRDLVPWMRLHLNQGRHAGKSLISAESLAETHRAQIILPLPSEARERETTRHSYGLGWHLFDYRGASLLEHGGANDGFRGRIVLVPAHKIGIALLTNCEDTEMLTALGFRLVDELLGLPARDWVGRYHRLRKETPRPLPSRKLGTRPSLVLPGYAGVYRDPAYGDMIIAHRDGVLSLRWSSFQVELGHYHFDTFLSKAPASSSARLNNELATFHLDDEANVASVTFLGRTFRPVLRR
ncbi:MAG: serine hydrolase [Gemmataceae bacterium]